VATGARMVGYQMTMCARILAAHHGRDGVAEERSVQL